jgi:ATP synthase protein I
MHAKPRCFFGGCVPGKEPNERSEGVGEGITSSYRKAGPYIDASWQLAGSVGLGTLAGYWLDKKLGTTPWLLVVGALSGIGLGFYLFFKILTNLNKGRK